jgi:hypothetical protein
VISVFGILGGGHSGYTTTTDATGTHLERVDNPFGPGDILRSVPNTSSFTDFGLGDGFNGGVGVAVDEYWDECDDDDCDEDCEWGVGSELEGIGGENDSAVVLELNVDYSIRVHNQDRLVFSAGPGVVLSSHFADPVGVIGLRYNHPINSEWGAFAGVEGVFGGDTSLGEFKFGLTYKFGP